MITLISVYKNDFQVNSLILLEMYNQLTRPHRQANQRVDYW